MPIHDTTASLSSAASIYSLAVNQQSKVTEYTHFEVGVDTEGVIPRGAHEYLYINNSAIAETAIGAEYIYGTVGTNLLSTASLTADAYVQTVFVSYGTASSANPLVPSIPSGTTGGDYLALWLSYKGYSGINWNGLNDPDFFGLKDIGYARVSGYYQWSSTYGVDTGEASHNVYGGEVGGGVPYSQSPSFTPQTGGTNILVYLRFRKEASKEWDILYFRDNYPSTSGTSISRYLTPYPCNNYPDSDNDTRYAWSLGQDPISGLMIGFGIAGHGSEYGAKEVWASYNGTKWDKIGTISTGENFGDPTCGNGIWLVRSELSPNYLWRSTNGGATWSNTNVTAWASLGPFFLGGYFWKSDDASLKKSTDGLNWTNVPLSPTPASNNGFFGLDYDPVTKTYVACGNNGMVYVSHNDGVSFTRVSTNVLGASLDPTAVVCGKKQNGSNFWVIVGWGDSTNGGGAAYSADNGDTWTIHSTTQTPFHDNQWNFGAHSIAFNGNTYYVAAGGTYFNAYWSNSDTYLNWDCLSDISRSYSYSYGDLFADAGGVLWNEKHKTWYLSGYYLYKITDGSEQSRYFQPGDLVVFAITSPDDTTTFSNVSIDCGNVTFSPPQLTSFTTTADNDLSTHFYSAYVTSLSGSNQYYPIISATSSITGLPASEACASLMRIRAIPQSTKFSSIASMSVSAEVKKIGIEEGSPGHTYTASMEVDAYLDNSGTKVGGIYAGNYTYNETLGTQISIATASGVMHTYGPALIFVAVVADNASATTPTFTISDDKGNTYSTVAFKGQNASANAGVVAGLYYTTYTPTQNTIVTVTATASSQVTCKIISVFATYWVEPTQVSTAVTASGSSATPSVTSGTVDANSLVVGLFGVENSTTPTADSDTLNGSWYTVALTASGTGGNSATHQSIYMAYKKATASGAQTFNPATSPSTDWAGLVSVFKGYITSKAVSTVIRARTTMTANLEVVKYGSASVSGAGTVVAIGDRAGNGGTASGVGTVTAEGTVVYGATVSGVGSVTAIGTAGSRASVSGAGSVDARAAYAVIADVSGSGSVTANNVISATASVVGVGYAVGAQIHDTTVAPMNAVAVNPTIWAAASYVTRPTDEYDDPPTPWGPPEDYPSFDNTEWTNFTSAWGPTGELGNPIELTNRHYQGALFSTLMWSHPNGPNAGYYDTYTVGARASAVTPLGGDRFLVTWVQENWHQYYQDWIGYNTIHKEQSDLPLCIVATILDCSGDGDPVITGSSRYDLPMMLRFWRNCSPQDAKVDPSGNVVGVLSGFPIMYIPFTPDIGSYSDIYTDPVNIAFKVNTSGAKPSFSWVKTFSTLDSVTNGFYNQVVFDGSDPVIVSAGYDNTKLLKLSGSSGASLGTSSTIPVTTDWNGGMAALYKGSSGVIIGDIYGEMKYVSFNTSTLSVGSVNTFSPTINLTGDVWKAKKGADGLWYVGASTDESAFMKVFAFDIVDGDPVLVETYAQDVLAVRSGGPSSGGGLTYQNYTRSYNMLEFWVPWGSGGPVGGYSALVSVYNKVGFCPGLLKPSLAACTSWMFMNQVPEHRIGVQVIGQISPITEDAVALKPGGWISPPAASPVWGHYFGSNNSPAFCEMDCAEISNGKILVIAADTYSHSDVQNGAFRIFAYIADPQDDPPPLKLSQRDDDKVAGARRIGYDPQQESVIRAGWVAW